MRELQLVHNDDGTQPMSNVRLGNVKADYERWLCNVLETGIDTYVQCVAHPDVCSYATRVGEQMGMGPERSFETAGWWHIVRAHKELMAQGTDMLRVATETAHKAGCRFLAGIRMSDAHHAFGAGYPKDPLFPKFTHEHPEYRIPGKDGKPLVTLDYSHAAVRDMRLAILREIAHEYSVDGLELDFMRFSQHFARPATLEQIDIMTGFLRQIRTLLDEEARARGQNERPVLGARLPSALSACAELGLAPESWARQGLIDYLNPADFLWADYNHSLADYLSAVKGTDCRVLFSIQPWTAAPWGNETLPYQKAYTMEMPEFRALAGNGWATGAHGLHSFNLCCELPGRLKTIQEALRMMTTRDGWQAGPRHYQIFPSDFPKQSLCFEPGSAGKSLTFKFQMADGARRPGPCGRLAWRIYQACQTDEWAIRLNGMPVSPSAIRAGFRSAGWPVRTGAELPSHMYYEMDLEHAPSLLFRNELELTPTRLEPGYQAKRVMEVIEAWVNA